MLDYVEGRNEPHRSAGRCRFSARGPLRDRFVIRSATELSRAAAARWKPSAGLALRSGRVSLAQDDKKCVTVLLKRSSSLLTAGFPDDSATYSRTSHIAPRRFHNLAFVLAATFALQHAGCFSPAKYTSSVPVEPMKASESLNVGLSRYLLRRERFGAEASLGPIGQFDSLESIRLI